MDETHVGQIAQHYPYLAVRSNYVIAEEFQHLA